MPDNLSHLRIALFYSYSHKDIQYKEDMETILSTLRNQGFLKEWSDAQIMPGQSISAAIRAKIPESDIVVFLLSPDFLGSAECIKEWELAKASASCGRLVFRVPIIVRDCPWQDFLGDDDVKALPLDGKAIATYPSSDSAWNEVYEGIKSVVESLRTTYTPKATFLDELQNADIPSSKPLSLDDIFVFPRLIEYSYASSNNIITESPISSLIQLRTRRYSIIYGEDKSGKTALARHLAYALVKESQPVLFVDLGTVTVRINDKHLQKLYEDQFNGDYQLWQQQDNRTLVIDNVTETPRILDFISESSNEFSHIYLFVSSDLFHSFLSDEVRLAEFHQIRLEPLTHTQQEILIRNRLTTLEIDDRITDGFVDHVEDRVNSIIISNKIVPRYPFFVLSILQTYDASMPHSLPITSYGHCYYIFIVASLLRAGISEADDAVNASFNFAEQLALATFLSNREANDEPFDFDTFKAQYGADYFMETSLLNRLTHKDFGIIASDGTFKTKYMYYFFLGKLLATSSDLAEEYLPELCEHSYDNGNFLTLLFAIHHATDDEIIADIILRTMVDVEDVPAATLSADETSRFASIVSELPESVLSGDSVEHERARERRTKEVFEDVQDDDSEVEAGEDREQKPARIILRVLKNNRLLGQVLRNQYGKLRKNQIEEIVETITDSSFRLINLLLKDDDEIRNLTLHIQARWPDADLDEVQRLLTLLSFLWAMTNIEQAVHAVSVSSIRDAVHSVVERNGTPAYEIFGYFCELDSGDTLTREISNNLDRLYSRHQDNFVKRVLSIRTQWYMNTHRSKMSVEQSICSVLRIQYKPRLEPATRSIS